MTVIIGLEHGGIVTLAADSCVVGDDVVTTMRAPKVVQRGDVVLGVAGSLRPLVLVTTLLVPPPLDDLTPVAWAVSRLAPAIADLLGDGDAGIDVLAGVGGHLVGLSEDGSAHDYLDGYAAIGTGAEPALGALFATPHHRPQRRLRIALEAAATHCAGVRAPWVFASTCPNPPA